MQGFARSLGVGCDHCHMGESMETMDWANDDKDAKKNAREMMRLVRTINEGLAGLTKTDHTRAEVGCESCHRGLAVPPRPSARSSRRRRSPADRTRPSPNTTACTWRPGMPGSTDFRERALNTAARRLRDEKRLPDAIALLRKNASLFPRSADVAAMLGSMLAESGDVEGGRAELQRALEIDPENRAARGALGRLTGAAKPAP